MKSVLAFFLVSIASFAQTLPVRIPPDEAAKHLSTSTRPKYPPLAEQARIQGNVILEIEIDPSGATSSMRLVSGHPMLVAAAMEAVRQWKYQPFDVAGHPGSVKTFVMVTFGNPSNHVAQDRAELVFQNDFWTLFESADGAVAKSDFRLADEKMAKAGETVSADSKGNRHIYERWRWMTAMGRLRMFEHKNDEAEQYYKDALATRENNKQEDGDTFEIGASLANLAAFYRQEKKLDLAHNHADRALAIFNKSFKSVGQSNPSLRQVYGRAVVQESLLLLEIAKDQNDSAQVNKQCGTLTQFQAFLTAEGQSTFHSQCQPSK